MLGAGEGDSAQARGVGADVTSPCATWEWELGPVGPWYRESRGEVLHVTTMFGSSRGGVRGGQDQFSWEDVKTDKQRENYLGEWGAGTRSSRAVGSPTRGPCRGLGALFPQATR